MQQDHSTLLDSAYQSVEPISPQRNWCANEIALLMLIVCIASLLRIVRLDEVPPGINQDEAANAYDAYSLLKTGKDRGGDAWPLFTHSLGAKVRPSAPFIYLLIPLQSLLGLNLWSTRLPPAIFGTITVALVHLLVRRFYNPRTGLFAAAILAASPWHVHLSRLGFEVSICPFLITMGLWLYSKGLGARPRSSNSQSLVLFFVAGLTLGLALWTYNAMRVLIPILLLGGIFCYVGMLIRFARREQGPAAIVIFVVGLMIGCSPLLWATLKMPDVAWGRAGSEVVFARAGSLFGALSLACQSYAHQVSPSFLFWNGDPSLIHNMPGYGEVQWLCAPLMALGLIRILQRHRTEPAGRFLLLWLIATPIPAALTKLDAGHALRAAGALPAIQILAALGADFAICIAGRWSRSISVAIAALTMVFGARFAHLYFWTYSIAAAPVFFPEWKPVVEEVQRRQAEYDLVLLSSRECGQNGIMYLFWSGMDPHAYFAAPKNIWQGPEWEVLLQVNHVFFVPFESLAELIPQLPPEIKNPRVLVAERPGVKVPGTVLKSFMHPDGRESMVLYDVRVERN